MEARVITKYGIVRLSPRRWALMVSAALNVDTAWEVLETFSSRKAADDALAERNCGASRVRSD